VVEKEDFSYCMPEFIGLCDPIAAIWRIHEMENIFKAIKWANEDKVVYVISKLRSKALSAWWDMVKITSMSKHEQLLDPDICIGPSKLYLILIEIPKEKIWSILLLVNLLEECQWEELAVRT
ncbi:hypothetical protein Tco_0633696, partial [Tanacetum coccineum]